MLIIGIDPGISGSICFLEDGIIKDVLEMPTMTEGKKNKKQVNGSQIFNEISFRIKTYEKKNIKVVIEQVSAMPGQGVTSMFNFGQSFGILKGICSAMQLPIYFVRPAKWKKYFNLINSEKDASRTRAIEIFPYFSSNLSKKKDSNKADAILIASYFHETYKKATFVCVCQQSCTNFSCPSENRCRETAVLFHVTSWCLVSGKSGQRPLPRIGCRIISTFTRGMLFLQL